jgi:hypothetical protein
MTFYDEARGWISAIPKIANPIDYYVNEKEEAYTSWKWHDGERYQNPWQEVFDRKSARKQTSDELDDLFAENPNATKAFSTVMATERTVLVDRALWMAGLAPGDVDTPFYAAVSYALSASGYGNDLTTMAAAIYASHMFQKQFGGTMSKWLLYLIGIGENPVTQKSRGEDPEGWEAYNEYLQYPVCTTPCKPNKSWYGTEQSCRAPTFKDDGYEWPSKCDPNDVRIKQDPPTRPKNFRGSNVQKRRQTRSR